MRIKGRHLYEVIDYNTGDVISYERTYVGYDGTTITSLNEYAYLDNVLYVKLTDEFGGGYAKRVLIDDAIGIKSYGISGNGSIGDFVKIRDAVSFATKCGVSVSIDMNIDLGGGELILPNDSKLIFQGGIISNGSLVGNRTEIISDIVKIFDSVTLSGSFVMPYICPQHFGAKTNASNTVFENDCSSAIQSCINSPINTYLPDGFYYINSSLYFNKPTNVTLSGYNNPDPNLVAADHARVYTDQDDLILMHIQSRGVCIIGGTIDVTQADDFVGVVIRYDLNYPIWGGTIDTRIIGAKTTASKFGKGGIGIWVDQSAENITENHGHAVWLNFKGDINYMHTGIYGDARNDGKSTYWNSTNITCNMVGCKKFLNIGKNACNRSVIKGQYQVDGHVLADGEEDFFAVELGSNNTQLDVFLWDLDRENAYKLTGRDTQIGPRTQHHYVTRNIDGHYSIETPAILNSRRSLISKHRNSNRNEFNISKLDSETVSFDKRYSVSMKAYKGASINFDTDLDETSGLLETSDITLSNIGNLFNFSSPPQIVFTENADLDNDFVEIVLSGGSWRWQGIYLYVSVADQNNFNRIQLIEHYGDGSKGSYNIYPNDLGQPSYNNKTYIFDDVLPTQTSTKVIIRFIGNKIANEASHINDIMGVTTGIPVLPYIHIDGGQRIFGSLEADGLHNTSSEYTKPFRMGNYRIWVDSNGKLRIKNGSPNSDSDGNVVGS